MTEKFKVGDRVYDIRFGIGKVVTYRDKETSYPFDVEFIGEASQLYTACGRFSLSNVNPTLLTLADARSKGYDVPKEKVKKSATQYCLVYQDGSLSGQRFKTRSQAAFNAINQPTVIAIAEAVFTWEEEI